jgi:hypothetical protein
MRRRCPGKIVEVGVRPTVAGGCQLKDSADVIRALTHRCAIEITRPVHRKRGPGPGVSGIGQTSAVPPGSEAVEQTIDPTCSAGESP